MIKLYALLPRRDGLTREQFSRHWSTVHREHALRIDRIRRYVQAHGIRPGLPGLAEAEWDGVPEVWFSNLESALGQRTDPQYTEHAHLDEPNFIAMDRLRRLLAVHHVLRDPGEVTTKLLVFVCSSRGRGPPRSAPRSRPPPSRPQRPPAPPSPSPRLTRPGCRRSTGCSSCGGPTRLPPVRAGTSTGVPCAPHCTALSRPSAPAASSVASSGFASWGLTPHLGGR